MKSLRLLKIPQILGAGLAANVFITIAGQIKNLDNAHWQAYGALVCAFALNLKDFFDDMKAYEITEMEGFSLFPTVTFRVLSYMSIAWAVIELPDYKSAYFALVFYFSIFIVWSLNSIIRRISLRSNSKENSERIRRRMVWLLIYTVNACACFILSFGMHTLTAILLLIFIFAMFVLDAVDSDTFSNKINETL